MKREKLMKFKNLFNLMLEKYTLEDIKDQFSFERGDEVDQITTERDKSLLLKLRKRKELFVLKIKEALKKIDAGDFGECTDCGEGIETKRLIARPTARLCIKCKEEQERDEGKVLYKKRSHTLGKEIISDNIIQMPRNGDLSLDEKILRFNRGRLCDHIALN